MEIPNSMAAPADGTMGGECPEEYRRTARSVLWLTVREGRRFILKGLPESVRSHPEDMMRLRKEFSLGLRINHPGVAGVYGFETHSAVGPVIVMEYVDGITLGDFLDGRERKPLETRLSIARQIADALSYIHSLGLSHRDLKPDNILVTRRNEAKIIDIGLGDSEDSVIFKQSLGTEAFGAPEQMEPSAADFRADVYSYGKILESLLPESKFRRMREACLEENPDMRISIGDVADRLKDAGAGRGAIMPIIMGCVMLCLLLAAAVVYLVPDDNMSVASEARQDAAAEPVTGSQEGKMPESTAATGLRDATTSPAEAPQPAVHPEDRKTEVSEVRAETADADNEAIYEKYLEEAEGLIRKSGCAYDEEKGCYIEEVLYERGDRLSDIMSRMVKELGAADCPYGEMSRLSNQLYDRMMKLIEGIDGRKLQ